jgi:hypothetical protein
MTLTQADLDFIAEAKVDGERFHSECRAERERREREGHQEFLKQHPTCAHLFETPTRFENWYYGEVVPGVKKVFRACGEVLRHLVGL